MLHFYLNRKESKRLEFIVLFAALRAWLLTLNSTRIFFFWLAVLMQFVLSIWLHFKLFHTLQSILMD